MCSNVVIVVSLEGKTMVLAEILFGLSIALNTGDFLTKPDSRYEGNPVYNALEGKPLLQASYKAAGVIIPELIARKFEKKGCKKEAKIIRIGVLIFPIVGIVTNVRGKIIRHERIF